MVLGFGSRVQGLGRGLLGYRIGLQDLLRVIRLLGYESLRGLQRYRFIFENLAVGL